MTSRPKKSPKSARARMRTPDTNNADDTEAPTAKSAHQTQHGGSETSQSKQEPPTTSDSQTSGIQKILHKLWWRTHWLLPNFIPAPYSDRTYQQASDKKANEESRVNDGEEFRVRAVWGVELFGPNESDRLYEALRVLGWSAGFGAAEDGALTWVQQQRSYGHGGTYNVGVVTQNSNTQKFLGVQNRASLPEDVEYLLVSFHQIVPTVTCVVVCFVLKEEATTRYEQELNLVRTSRRERSTRWSISRVDPSHLKQRAVEAVRRRFRRTVTEWFKRNLPGYFSHSSLPQRFPTAELLCTKLEDVFVEKKHGIHFDWRRIISNVAPQEIWASKDSSGLRFTLHQERWPRAHENFLIASTSLQSLPEDRIRMYGGGAGSIVAICHESLEGTLARFAVSAFLAEVAHDLKNTREELSLSKSNRKTVRTIDRVQRFFDRNAGVPAVVRELRDLTKTSGFFEHYCEHFTAEPWRNDQPNREFAKELREGVYVRASTLIEDESSTREHFGQLSAILSIRESVRAQRKMEVLTFVALFVATVS
jgi:hypothetical protein